MLGEPSSTKYCTIDTMHTWI